MDAFKDDVVVLSLQFDTVKGAVVVSLPLGSKEDI
jgi:hypothetical protein